METNLINEVKNKETKNIALNNKINDYIQQNHENQKLINALNEKMQLIYKDSNEKILIYKNEIYKFKNEQIKKINQLNKENQEFKYCNDVLRQKINDYENNKNNNCKTNEKKQLDKNEKEGEKCNYNFNYKYGYDKCIMDNSIDVLKKKFENLKSKNEKTKKLMLYNSYDYSNH